MLDMDALKDIPGYKAIMKSVLKSQIQLLIEQLSSHTGEESIILTASVHDGTLSHLGSTTGKGFLEGRDEIKSQFLGYCLKTHHKVPSLETNKSPYQRPVRSPSSPTVQPGSVKRPRTSHPVMYMTRPTSSDQLARPRPPQMQPSTPTGITDKEQSNASEDRVVVKQEFEDDHTNDSEHSEVQGADNNFASTSSLPASLQLSHTQTSGDRPNSESQIDNEDSNDQNTSIKTEPMSQNAMELEGDASMSGAESWAQGQGYPGYGTEGDSSFSQEGDQSGYNDDSIPSFSGTGMIGTPSRKGVPTTAGENASPHVPPMSMGRGVHMMGGENSLKGPGLGFGRGLSMSPGQNLPPLQVQPFGISRGFTTLTGQNASPIQPPPTGLGRGGSLASDGALSGDGSPEKGGLGSELDAQGVLDSYGFLSEDATKPFGCCFCQKCFTQKADLKRHVRIHTGSRPFKCKYCEKGFTQSTHLRIHEGRHEKRDAFLQY